MILMISNDKRYRLQGARSKATLKPVIADNHIVAMKESVKQIVHSEFIPAQEFTKNFEKYRFLINKEVWRTISHASLFKKYDMASTQLFIP